MDALDKAEIRLKYTTHTDKALDKAREIIEEGGRLGVPKIVVLITDGAATLHDEAVAAAANVQAEDIKIFALGLYPETRPSWMDMSIQEVKATYDAESV